MTTFSDLLLEIERMKTEISTLIMRMRRSYGERRIRLRRSLSKLGKSSFRKEMKRRGRITSWAMIKAKEVGYFQEEEKRDLENLDAAVSGDGGDLVEALRCLQEACTYLDIMIRHPFMMGTTRYRKWSQSLDSFLGEMREQVDYRRQPGHHSSSEVEIILERRLREMKIHENSVAQKEIRFKLEDAMQKLFVSMPPEREEIKMKLMKMGVRLTATSSKL